MILNGLAKSGNHALKKTCALLGVELQVNHIRYADKVQGEKYLFVARHPKNVMCSAIRMTRGCATPMGMINSIPYGVMGSRLNECAEHFAPWLHDADTTVIRYENELMTPAGVQKVADWLGVPFVDVTAQIPGDTVTWTGRPSDWQLCWNDEVQAVWEANGGLLLEAAYGY